MVNGIRPRAVSAPVTPMELRELNKYKDKRICKEDLELFVDKYRKESKFFFRLPPEINLIKSIVNKCKSSLLIRLRYNDQKCIVRFNQ